MIWDLHLKKYQKKENNEANELYFLLDNEKKYNTHDEPLQNEKFEEDEKKCFTVALEGDCSFRK